MLRPTLVLLSPVLAVLTFMALAAATLGAPPPSECRVTAYIGDRYHPGSGTVIASGEGKTRVLTCYHVTTDRSDKIIVTHNGREYPGKLIAWDSGADLACVEVVGAELPAAKVAKMVPPEGSKLIQWGHEKESASPVAKSGTVTVHRESTAEMFTNIRAELGDSGCGVFNEAGELVGVCSLKRKDGTGSVDVGLAIIREFLYLGPPDGEPAKPGATTAQPAASCPTGST